MPPNSFPPRRCALLTVIAAACLLLGCASPSPPDEAVATRAVAARPNLIFILVDDLRWDELGVAGHPYLHTPNIDRLAHEGAMFLNAFHAVPLCSPNRASILTGQYPSRHGIIDNVARNRASHRLQTFPQALQKAGYETGYLGKWHMGNDPTERPGFDYWTAIPGQGRSTNPELYEDGEIHTVEGYLTDILTDRAVNFIERERDRPFMLYIGHKAMHPDIQQLDDGSADPSSSLGQVPAPRHRGRYAESMLPPRPNKVESLDELSDRPALRRALERKLDDDPAGLQPDLSQIRGRAEMLLAVDDGIGRILDTLEQRGLLENTAVIFTGDNGFWYGEHGLTVERRLPYEEGIRMPLLIRYPGIISPNTKIEEMVSSVDIAPTALELGDHVQGRSLVGLLDGSAQEWRDAVLIEFYTYENPFPWLVDMDYRAIRTNRYKYIHWIQHPDESELYDLVEDPYEMTNRIDDAALKPVLDDLRGRLRQEQLRALGLTH
jgi:arylsulfatase A-like enzyme